jgi:pilus assembly protein CpaE
MQDEVARVVLALESPEVAEEVMHFLDRSGRVRVVGTAVDTRQLADAVRQLEPDAIVAAPALAPARTDLNGSALLAVDTTQSVATLRRALRAGASGFYLWPAEREDLAIAAGRVRPVFDAASQELGTVIAVYGARGGIGTTFVATHLAAAFARVDRRCALVDLDLAFAGVTASLGAADAEDLRTIADLVPLGEEIAPVHVAEILRSHPSGFRALLAPGSVAGMNVRDADIRAIVDATRRGNDPVVLHLPRALDAVCRTAVEIADRVVLVVGLDVVSLRDAKRVIESMALEDRVEVVVNRSGRSDVTVSDVERVFGRAPLGVIPADGRIATAQQRGELVPFRGRVGRQLQRIAASLLEERIS